MYQIVSEIFFGSSSTRDCIFPPFPFFLKHINKCQGKLEPANGFVLTSWADTISLICWKEFESFLKCANFGDLSVLVSVLFLKYHVCVLFLHYSETCCRQLFRVFMEISSICTIYQFVGSRKKMLKNNSLSVLYWLTGKKVGESCSFNLEKVVLFFCRFSGLDRVFLAKKIQNMQVLKRCLFSCYKITSKVSITFYGQKSIRCVSFEPELLENEWNSISHMNNVSLILSYLEFYEVGRIEFGLF